VINAVNQDVKPDAEDAREKHFPEAWLIGYAKGLHQAFENAPQRIRRSAPQKPQYCPNEKRMAIPMAWIPKAEYGYNQDLNIDNHIGKDKYRYVEPFSKYQPDETTRPKMIRRKRHSKASLKT
jgi:hypothetical protein